MKEPWELAWVEYYDALGIEPDAETDEIHIAFRSLARIYHPDRHHGASADLREEAERHFRIIGEAHEVLRDPARRASYDDARARSIDGGAPRLYIEVDPPEHRVFTWTGDFIVSAHLTLPRDAPAALLSVDCDDADVELRSVDVRDCTHGRPRDTDVTVRARLHARSRRALQIEYALGGHRVTQAVQLDAPPSPLLWLGRRLALRQWPTVLAITGALTLLAIPMSLRLSGGFSSAEGILFIAGFVQIVPLIYIASNHFFSRPKWVRQLSPRGRWAYLILIFAGFQILRIVLRQFF